MDAPVRRTATNDAKTLRQFADCIVAAMQPLRIILFGSAVRNELTESSDLDVLVVMPDGTHRRKTAQLIRRQLVASGWRFAVDVVVVTEDDIRRYADNWSMVIYPALREGREIYAA